MSKRFDKKIDTLLKKGELFKSDVCTHLLHRESLMKCIKECGEPMTKPMVNEENIEKRITASCKFIGNLNEYMEETEKYIKSANEFIEFLLDFSYDAVMEYFKARHTMR